MIHKSRKVNWSRYILDVIPEGVDVSGSLPRFSRDLLPHPLLPLYPGSQNESLYALCHTWTSIRLSVGSIVPASVTRNLQRPLPGWYSLSCRSTTSVPLPRGRLRAAFKIYFVASNRANDAPLIPPGDSLPAKRFARLVRPPLIRENGSPFDFISFDGRGLPRLTINLTWFREAKRGTSGVRVGIFRWSLLLGIRRRTDNLGIRSILAQRVWYHTGMKRFVFSFSISFK